MRLKPLFIRSTATIVQQTNTVTTRDVLRKLAQGVNLDLPSGSPGRSFDFDDQTKVDFDAPFFEDSRNLLHQSTRTEEFKDHLKRESKPIVEDQVDIDPPPDVNIID